MKPFGKKIDSQSLYSVFNYKIDIEELISPVFHLIIELFSSTHNNQHFYDCGGNLFDVKSIYGQKTIPHGKIDKDEEDDKDNEVKQSLLIEFAKLLNSDLYENTIWLNKTDIFVIYKQQILIAKTKKSSTVKKILTSWLQDFSPLTRLFSFVIDEQVKRLENKLSVLLNEANYSKVISICDENVWDSCIVPAEWLISENLKREIIDPDSVWVNPKIESIVGKDADCYDRSYAEGVIGFDIGNYTIPFKNIDQWVSKISFSQYFMKMLEEVYSSNKDTGDILDKNIEPFLQVSKDTDFCKLLSFLKYNLYIIDNEVIIPEKYKSLFDEVIGIEQISNVDNFQLYVSKPSIDQIRNNATLVGIYKKRKTGTEYNLLNWIHSSESSEALSITGSSKQSKQNIKTVFALRPHYYYYFVSKFFEDNFASLLKDLDCDSRTNLSLVKKGETTTFIEIDSIIRKKDGSLLYVENKTTLNKQNVEETIEKIEKFHFYMLTEYPSLHFQYLIVAPYCNASVDDGFRFFIKDGQSKTRNCVKTKIYDFNIPIAKFPDVFLRCVVEPEYDRLLNKMKEIIQ